jgi:hypothetical protein
MTTPNPENPAYSAADPRFTPDPTAISGTLETSGTGGGRNEHLTGVTRIFNRVEEVVEHAVQEIRTHLHPQEATSPPVEDAQTPEGAPEPVTAPVAGQSPAEAVQAVPVVPVTDPAAAAVPEDEDPGAQAPAGA